MVHTVFRYYRSRVQGLYDDVAMIELVDMVMHGSIVIWYEQYW